MKSIFNLAANLRAFSELTLLLTRHRRLAYELAKREIGERYSGQFLGALWAIGHPLLLTLVYIFLFAFVFRMRVSRTLDMPLDYTAYMLAGLFPWLAMQEALAKASTVIIGNANVVKQVIFPLEILPVKSVLATLATFIVFLGLTAIYTLVTSQTLLWTYLLIPVLFVFQALAMIGVTYILSAVGVYFRDTKDLVQVFVTIAFFLLPILYLPEAVPTVIRPILFLNPISYLVWCWQDILYFGRFAHPWAWAIFLPGSVFLFVFGYRVFRRLKIMFGNVL